MSRDPNARSADILYIGRVDTNHERFWQQLQRDGIVVSFARTQRSGLQMLDEVQPQLVVVNAANSTFSGDRLCRTLGRRLPSAQRLLIAEAGGGANVPCEQRLVQPFTGRRLRECLLQMLQAAVPHILAVGPIELDLVSRIVTTARGQQRLTPKQCSLLTVLMQHPNQVISRKDLMRRVWDTDFLDDMRTLDVHIRWLREKIELDPPHPALILTRRGIGYLLSVPELKPVSDDPDDADPL